MNERVFGSMDDETFYARKKDWFTRAAAAQRGVGTARPLSDIVDELAQEIESLCDASIHELVFLSHHVNDNQPDDARNCLTSILLNLDRLTEILNP